MLEALLAAAVLQAPAAAPFTEADFAHVARLAGRWEGRSPDGQPVAHHYELGGPRTLRITRWTGAVARTVTTGQVIRFADGAITLDWGSYSWRAIKVTPALIRFEPVRGPSHALSWRFVDGDTVEAGQDWRDADGRARTYVLRMRRVR